eukprot:scaffold156050_cov16-Tisochrysis_lutea.AAC.2
MIWMLVQTEGLRRASFLAERARLLNVGHVPILASQPCPYNACKHPYTIENYISGVRAAVGTCCNKAEVSFDECLEW